MMNKIIEWNIKGAKTNIKELMILTLTFNPAIICLHESHLKGKDTQHKTLLRLIFHQARLIERQEVHQYSLEMS